MRRNADRIGSKHVCVLTVTDPDTHLPVEVEIRKMATGPMVGLDASWLHNLPEDEQPNSPYDEVQVLSGEQVVKVEVPDDETDQRGARDRPDAWSTDEIQFPRLIAELEVAGAFTDEILSSLCGSMDLERDEVLALVSRAQHTWDRIKEGRDEPVRPEPHGAEESGP